MTRFLTYEELKTFFSDQPLRANKYEASHCLNSTLHPFKIVSAGLASTLVRSFKCEHFSDNFLSV